MSDNFKNHTGKLTIEQIQEVIFDHITTRRDEVVLHPGLGEDCAALDLGSNLCVVATDPITGASQDIGSIAVHVNCNDVAACGAEPVGLLLTILAPKGTTKEEIAAVMEDAQNAAAQINVQIIGGHTEITTAVNQMIVSGTAVGKCKKEKLVRSDGAKVGDSVIMTKYVGLEGSLIIAKDFREKTIKAIGKEATDEILKLEDDLGVVTEGLIAAEMGASAMHDITEGGILGAIYELCLASQVAVTLYEDKIPILEGTKKLAQSLVIDPLRLISSGSMLITTSAPEKLLAALDEKNVKATVVGEITPRSEGMYLVQHDQDRIEFGPPRPDELLKVIGS